MSLKWPPLTLRARLALWAALATGLAVALVAGGLYVAVNGFLLRSQQDRLLSAVSAVQERVEGELGRAAGPLGFGVVEVTVADLERIVRSNPQTRNLELRLVSVQLGVVSQVQTANFPAGVALNLRDNLYRLNDQLITVRGVRARGPGRDLQGDITLAVATDAQALTEAQRAFGRALAWLLPAALLLSLAVGWGVAGRLLRPVRALEGAARDIGAGGDLRRPVPGAGQGDELARLALTLQGTFGGLADAREREQAFLRAAAHDLRSPLAAVQARVEGTLARERDAARYRAELREVGTDMTRLATLTNHLLLLARDAEAMGRAPVPLRDLAADAVDRARELSPEADVDLLAPAPVSVQGDRVLLGQAIWNLTMNAVRHAPGATITVQVEAEAGGATVTVQDDGPGVGADVLARLGEAFYRPDAARSGEGHGLGLAIVRRAAELHGGTLTLESAPGAGFTGRLYLPG
ncbi:HAMP domain-containing sensor histidine kinase [Deinococcus sp. QL22]|uniref:sensor histidine kinase n=1 Tax=Deinococcus sp. QL22 TaxID=2939437 RepID=UPI002016C83D|nr:HAMP domain-containing sensor histidine kinase [Deinococcus sp. QL22]UQN07216.1 HAMP domain-containing histidine kinase [Deinococcus sp. QL22]